MRRDRIISMIAEIRGGLVGEADGQSRTLEKIVEEINLIKERSKLTEAKKKEYEKFQQDKQKLDDLITSITRELGELETVTMPKMKADQEARMERYLDALGLLNEERAVLEKLYEPLKQALAKSNETAKKLTFVSRTAFDVMKHASRGIDLFDRRKSIFQDQESMENALSGFFEACQQNDFNRDATKQALSKLLESFRPSNIPEQLRKDKTAKDFADWFFDVQAFSTTYAIKFDDKDLRFLSPGEKGIVLLLLYLEAEEGDNRPLIIDQPDDNLDNLSVYPNLIDYFRARKRTRQIIIITHNPNLVVNTDSEQVIVASFDGTRTPKLQYHSGALEDTSLTGLVPGIREDVCRILEGGRKAFQLREARYALPKYGT
jgi:DNA gyrase/topoisomerase IV subunit A